MKTVTQSLLLCDERSIFRPMKTNNTFEIHGLDDKVWVRPYAGNEEFNGETFNTLTEAVAALPVLARELGWSDYGTTVAELKSCS
jgi:hypothetical protein